MDKEEKIKMIERGKLPPLEDSESTEKDAQNIKIDTFSLNKPRVILAERNEKKDGKGDK